MNEDYTYLPGFSATSITTARKIAKELAAYDASPKAGDKYKSTSRAQTITIADQNWMEFTWNIKSRTGINGKDSLWALGEDKLFRVPVSDLGRIWVKI